MPDSAPQPRHRFLAAIYDPFLRLSGGRLRQLRLATAGRARGRVLEIGAGTGLNLEVYDWQKVESLDLCEPDPYMLRRAQKRIDQLPADVRSRVRAWQIPAEALPFEDQSFDCVVSTLVLCTVADPAVATAEILRVLKPDGQVYLLEHVRGDGFTSRLQHFIQPLWGWTAGGCRLSRDTESTLADGGLDLDVEERMKLGPVLPAFRGVARRRP